MTRPRTGSAIALVVGAALAQQWGGLARWPLASLLVLRPSLGIELVARLALQLRGRPSFYNGRG